MLYAKSVQLNASISPATQILATRLSFFALGFSTAAWAPLIPFAQLRLQLNHADFGLLLLCMGIGSMLTMPLTGALIQRLGCRLVIGFGIISAAMILPLLTYLSTALFMASIMFVFGAVIGSLGIAINLQAVKVEKITLRNMMSSFHGMCSLGGLFGVLLMTVMLSFGLSALFAAIIISSILLIIALIAVPFCMRAEHQQDSLDNFNEEQQISTSKRYIPNFYIILMGGICFIAFLSEGAAMDWSGIYLVSKYGLDASFAGLAYTFFAISMTIGRFSGAYLLHYFGENKLIMHSALWAAIGMGMIVSAPNWPIVLVGYAILGLGCSNIVPLMFSRVGRQQLMPKAAALSFVSTMAYTGVLAGPALVGFLSELFSLTIVFSIITALIATIMLLNRMTSKLI